jgi:hypothetical protein
VLEKKVLERIVMFIGFRNIVVRKGTIQMIQLTVQVEQWAQDQNFLQGILANGSSRIRVIGRGDFKYILEKKFRILSEGSTSSEIRGQNLIYGIRIVYHILFTDHEAAIDRKVDVSAPTKNLGTRIGVLFPVRVGIGDPQTPYCGRFLAPRTPS